MPLDNTITRFPGGVTNSPDNSPFANLKINNPGGYHAFFEDFDKYTAAQWTVGGVGSPVTPALAIGDGGILQLTTSAASGDSNFVQQFLAGWTLDSAKRLFFSARFAFNTASLTAGAFGLMNAAPAALLTPADGIFVRRDAAGTFTLEHRIGGVATTSVSFGAPMVDATFVDVSLATDGLNVVAGINGQTGASITVPAFTAVNLKVTAGVANGTGALRIMSLDQLVCFKAH
jgi:hypothetical protein